MAIITRKVDKNIEPTSGERALDNGGLKQLVNGTTPVSVVVDTLTKRTREARLRLENYNYLASKLYTRSLRFDGLLDVDYTEQQTSTAGTPYGDTTIDDFNSGKNKAVRFTYNAMTESNVKTKILSSVLMNFLTNPADLIKSIFSSTENINKTQELFWAKQVWTIMNERFYTIELPKGTPDVPVKGVDGAFGDSVAQTAYSTLIKFGTTHKEHIGVGTDLKKPGVITTGKGDSVSPSMHYLTNEFFVIENINYSSNITYKGEKAFFNWNGGNIEVKERYQMDWDKAEEVPADVKMALANTRVLLIHKDSVMGIQDWVGSGVAMAGKLYSVVSNYLKQDAIPLYDAPIIKIDVKPEVVTPKVVK